MRKFESGWQEYCVIIPTGTRAVIVPLVCFTTVCVLHLLTLMVPLNIKFTPTLNVTKSIYVYKLL